MIQSRSSSVATNSDASLISNFALSFTLPTVWFGANQSARLRERMEQLRVSRALVATTASGAGRYSQVFTGIQGLVACVFDKAEPHCPLPVAQQALDAYRHAECDCVITVGGGSTIGLGKYLSVEAGAPHITLPTTLSGSEMTPLFGVLVGKEKRSRRDPRALADTVVVDPLLAVTLPLRETSTTGMNALAHCVEALYVDKRSPISHLLAIEGFTALFHALSGLAEKPDDLRLRSSAAYGALIGGMLVNMVGIGLHHRICHVLGGKFQVPHGESNCVLLPQVIAFNERHIQSAHKDMQAAIGARPAQALFDLVGRLGAPRSLREMGVSMDALSEVATESIAHTDSNPRPLDQNGVLGVLTAAWNGDRPA